MKKSISVMLVIIMVLTIKHAVAQQLSFSVDKIISATRKPYKNLVLLAAHRGLWENVPENSIEAIEAARVANFETIEIDVRLSNDGTPWLFHDFAMDRLTTGHGYVSMNRDSTITKMVHLKNRDESVSEIAPVKLEDAFEYLAKHLVLESDGTLVGFVMVVDLKSPPSVDPNANRLSGYAALKQSWSALKTVSARHPELLPPGARGPALGRAVIFKVKGREVPDQAKLESDLDISPDTDYFHLEPVLHSDNPDEGNRVFKTYVNVHYVVGFEAVLEYIGQLPSTTWVNNLKEAGRTIPGFPGWNDYPEGVAFASGACCYVRNTDPTDPTFNLDYSASIEFQLQTGANWLTADTVPVLNDLLAARGLRDVSQLLWKPEKGK